MSSVVDPFSSNELELDTDWTYLFFHSKLWKEKAKVLFYEICHNIVVQVHIAIYGHPPPSILEIIMGNLGKLVDCFIEDNFS